MPNASCRDKPRLRTGCSRWRRNSFAVARIKGLKRALNYGANRIRYLAPVPSGARLRDRVSIADAEDVLPEGLRVTMAARSKSKTASTRPASLK